MPTETHESPWSKELNAMARAFAGAFVFGMPLLFTMEMWWIGEYADRWKLLAFLVLAFGANFGLATVSGFRRDSTVFGNLEEAVESVAVGIVTATVVLVVLNQIRPSDPFDAIVGKILVQSIPLSLGVSVANEVFGRQHERTRTGDRSTSNLSPQQELLNDIGATAIGGVFVGFSIAPTEEVRMIASALDLPHLIALVGVTLLISYIIVFASGFDAEQAEGPFQHPLTETVLAYIVSLIVAMIALYLFDQITADQPIESAVRQMIVLAVPTTVGGAAGRLVV